MNKKKWLTGALAVLLTGSLLAGCSSKKEDNSPQGSSAPASSPQASSPQASEPSAEQVTLKVSISGSNEEKKIRTDAADMFMKAHPNIKIEWVDLGDDRFGKTLTLISGGETPDVLYMNDWVLPLAQKGVLKPLDDFMQNDTSFDVNQYYKPVVDANKYDGKLYALPQEVSPLVIYYNKDMFDKANIPYPKDDWTQDQFLDTAKKLTDPAKKQYGYMLYGFGYWGGFLARNGGHIYSADGTKSAFDSPEALNALKTMKRIVVDDHSSPNSAEQKAQGQSADAMFRNQQLAMFSAGMWWLPPFKAQPMNFKWDVVRMPKAMDQKTKAGVLLWGIGADTKHPQEAWEFLKFLEGSESMKLIAESNMALPASTNQEANQIILDSKFPDNVKAFIDSAPDVDLEEISNVKSAEVNEVIGKNLELMLLNKQSPEDTQKKITEGMNKVLSE